MASNVEPPSSASSDRCSGSTTTHLLGLQFVQDGRSSTTSPMTGCSRRSAQQSAGAAKLDDELLLRSAEIVTVCSPALAESRRPVRPVVVVPNGVDPLRFATPTPRPADLPDSPTAVYVGTLHDERLDVPLSCSLADELPHVQFVYVGPDSLQTRSRALLQQRPNVHLLGARDHDDVPSYYQHADVVIVPHLVSPFTESLDPIKAREILAVGTPTVSTAHRRLPRSRAAGPHSRSRSVRPSCQGRTRWVLVGSRPATNLITWADVATSSVTCWKGGSSSVRESA